MKDQLVLEGKDKQYLLQRIAELTGAPPKKQPSAYQRQKLQTVNEKAPPPGPVIRPQSKPEKNGDIGVEVIIFCCCFYQLKCMINIILFMSILIEKHVHFLDDQSSYHI